jgi:hypothetical protein
MLGVVLVAAIINKFRPPLATDQPWHAEMAEEMLSRKDSNNKLKEKCQRYCDYDDRPRENWQRVNRGCGVPGFPYLTTTEIERHITFGLYQIEQGKSYVREMFHDKGEFVLELQRFLGPLDDESLASDSDFEMNLSDQRQVIHLRLHSRHLSNKHYKIFIELDGAQTVPWKKLHAWYCTCPTGERTMGCCAHIASAIWWLGNGRMHDVVFYNGMWFNLRDASGDQSHMSLPESQKIRFNILDDDATDSEAEVDVMEARFFSAHEIDRNGESGGYSDNDSDSDSDYAPGPKIATARKTSRNRKFVQQLRPETVTVEIESTILPIAFTQPAPSQAAPRSTANTTITQQTTFTSVALTPCTEGDVILAPSNTPKDGIGIGAGTIEQPIELNDNEFNPQPTHLQLLADRDAIFAEVRVHTTLEQLLTFGAISPDERASANKIIEFISQTAKSSTDQDAPLINRNRFSASASELQCLFASKKTQWLNDAIMNSYIMLLQEKFTDCLFFNTFLFSQIENPAYYASAVKEWVARTSNLNKESHPKFIFVPVNILNQHWFQIVIDFEQQKIAVMDSNTNSQSRNYIAQLKKMSTEIPTKRLRSSSAMKRSNGLDLTSFFEVPNIGIAPIKQNDAYNCGPLTLIMMRVICQRNYLTTISLSEEQLSQFRLIMLLELAIGKLIAEW